MLLLPTNKAANNLASAKAELNQTITTKDTATNKRIDATNTTVSNPTEQSRQIKPMLILRSITLRGQLHLTNQL